MMQCWEFKVIVSKDTQKVDQEVNGNNTTNFAWQNNGGILMINTLAALLVNITERAIPRGDYPPFVQELFRQNPQNTAALKTDEDGRALPACDLIRQHYGEHVTSRWTGSAG